MKKIASLSIFSAFFLFTSCSQFNATYKVHPTSERTEKSIKNGLIYALPQTVLQIDLIVEKNEFVKGPYSEYARIFLGVNPDEAKASAFKLKDIHFSTHSEPDPKAYFFVEGSRQMPAIATLTNGIIYSVNDNGAPYSSNGSSRTTLHASSERENIDAKTFLEPTGSFNYIEKKDTIFTPTTIDQGIVSYEKTYQTIAVEKPVIERAKEAANTIFELRMKKRELLYGEYEDPYSRNAIEFIYSNLEKMEQELLSLFTGKNVIQTETKSFFIVPDKTLLIGDEQILSLCKFSPGKGVLNSDEVEGELVYTVIRCEQDLHIINNFLKRKQNTYNNKGRLVKKGSDKSKGFVYRIPDKALVKVSCGGKTFTEKITVNQYGTLVKLPSQKIEALFNTETGNIIKVGSLQKKK